MPQTPIFGIRYPCAGPPIALTDFSNFAMDIEAAIATVDARENLALQRNTAALRRNGATPQTIPVGVATNLTFLEENWDYGAMVDLTVNNDRITITRNGIYMIQGYLPANNGPTTVTSTAAIITVNGTAVAQNKRPGVSSPLTANVQVQAMYPCVIGDILRLQMLWTGTGGPANIGPRFVARMVAET